ncbi:MAG: OmpA family protein [Bacteroidales bacterium]|jgi:outer membrane protein OmpA-like peptidoglycan-associated protein|nr:OmpA family protein [Bacteroidales bacterium]MCK9498323.1 OmpA family protein [Bacteroidales bacterium]MDY0314574.1 OmpA family protein [Bacteroidales bacterium]NLB86024.1 OmpA family protein [Bacteroidales bacterium]
MKFKNIFVSFLICLLSFIIKAQNSESFYIHFDINSYEIETKYKSIFEDIDLSQINNIDIYAYTDFLGSKRYNDELSQKRAHSSKELLISLGIEPAKITSCQGKSIHKNSSFENRNDKTDRGIKEHRKSEIIITYTNQEQTKTYTYQDTISFAKELDNDTKDTDLSNIKAKDLEIGKTFNIKNINFEGGTPNFLPSADKPLQELSSLMRENPNLKIDIVGHICCHNSNETDGYDFTNNTYTLSKNRAEAVYNFLIKQGIDASRMSFRGVGSSQRLYPYERSAWEQEQNRRVEIIVVEN